MIKAIVPAALMAFALATSASAAPLTPAKAPQLSETNALQVQWRKKDRDRDYRRGFRAGERYDRAPRGWRRYGARPYGWRTRGCIVVGPVWFCP